MMRLQKAEHGLITFSFYDDCDNSIESITVTNSSNKKARYRFRSGLSMPHKAYLVGCAGVEPTTNGLKVRCSTN